MEKVRTILIPYDFTEKADNAFGHAVNVAKNTGHELILVHIVKDESEEEAVRMPLKDACRKLKEKYGVEPGFDVRPGDIFNTINNVAFEHNSDMVVMGTHGTKGVQKVTGSWALKVIVGSQVPFLVVQGPPVKDKIFKIVLPMDSKKEEKEKIKWAYYFSKHFKAKFIVVVPHAKDYWVKAGIRNNLRFLKNFFDGCKVNYEYENVKHSDLHTQSIEIAKKHDADMVMTIVKKHMGFSWFSSPRELIYLNNPYSLTIFCINPKPGRLTGGFSTSAG